MRRCMGRGVLWPVFVVYCQILRPPSRNRIFKGLLSILQLPIPAINSKVIAAFGHNQCPAHGNVSCSNP